ncbi:TPA: phage terminase small subunit [Klebsiella pneumoniae]|uniref:phage terminase small subunit n=1 Tax=Klebsiella pneumoniae TaxID=573 RepID=UPI0024B8895D|nr:phage terminase small subunit [Klebsiella pneumoniae]WHR12665.1 phage terminase small subunit [Klebsiella pneumoniae]HBS2867454.1 terminase [Klebsiella pneumoniae]HBS2935297.1 terminase [Klebsiella pneumoniae]HBS2952059.1 terminase [Klebsiella pneumoniae]HBS3001953.1 terminase [Klebsiella pneumoniae]
MLTPAQRHFQRVMAERHGKAEDLSDTARTAHEQILHRMRMDMAALKKIQGEQAKAALKRQMLPNYEGWIEGTLEGNSGRQDEVITRLMIWAIDVRDYPLAARIGRYVIAHNLAMPDRFNRTAATALVDEICDPILVQVKADDSTDVSPYLAVLDEVAEFTAASDMPDMVRAKLHKARAFALRNGTPAEQETALGLLRTALIMDPGAGVKKLIDKLAIQLKKSAAATITEGESAGNDAAEGQSDSPAAPPVPAVVAGKPAPKTARKSTAKKPAARKTTTKKAPAAKK